MGPGTRERFPTEVPRTELDSNSEKYIDIDAHALSGSLGSAALIGDILTCPKGWLPDWLMIEGLLGRLRIVPRPYPPEFRQRAVAVVRAGKQIKQVAYELGISAGCLHAWVRQDRIDRGELAGITTTESAELRAARKRIRELETELAIIRQASKFLAEEKPHPKGFTR